MTEKYKIFCICLFGGLCFGMGALAVDHYVTPPGGYGTNNPPYTNWADAATNIQWAVDVATNGETVWVTNGPYVLTNQIYITNGIILRSMNGRSNTFIDGNRGVTGTRCVYMSNAFAIVRGFCISNGGNTNVDGGGAYCYGGKLDDCLVTLNIASNGGGIYLFNGTITNCAIITNVAYGYAFGSSGGGGIFGPWDGYGYILNCNIISNCNRSASDKGNGGGAFIGGLGYLISECMFLQNWVPGYGGGLFICGQQNKIRNCTFSLNRSGWVGGGVEVYNSAVSFTNCIFSSNSAFNAGGGYYGSERASSGVRMCNSLFYSNRVTSANNAGGAIYNAATGGVFVNCTIADNRCQTDRNGVWFNTNTVTINCVIYSNTVYDVTNSAFTNCCLESTNGLQTSGCITNNPLFVDSTAGNYRLNVNSPCINAGFNQDWMTNAVDLDGRQRIRYGTVDIGAYERIYEGTIYMVP